MFHLLDVKYICKTISAAFALLHKLRDSFFCSWLSLSLVKALLNNTHALLFVQLQQQNNTEQSITSLGPNWN